MFHALVCGGGGGIPLLVHGPRLGIGWLAGDGWMSL